MSCILYTKKKHIGKIEAKALRRARTALSKHVECFWTRQPDVPVRGRGDVELIIRRLRQHGGHDAWQTAREIEQSYNR